MTERFFNLARAITGYSLAIVALMTAAIALAAALVKCGAA